MPGWEQGHNLLVAIMHVSRRLDDGTPTAIGRDGYNIIHMQEGNGLPKCCFKLYDAVAQTRSAKADAISDRGLEFVRLNDEGGTVVPVSEWNLRVFCVLREWKRYMCPWIRAVN